jgi:hypothetical protein
MRKVVRSISPEKWAELSERSKKENRPIYRVFRDEYEWEPSMKISLPGILLTDILTKHDGHRWRIFSELIIDGSVVQEINADAKANKDRYGQATHDADITLAIYKGYATLV